MSQFPSCMAFAKERPDDESSRRGSADVSNGVMLDNQLELSTISVSVASDEMEDFSGRSIHVPSSSEWVPALGSDFCDQERNTIAK